MTTTLGIIDLLKVFGFNDGLKSKIVRHQDGRYDLTALLREGWFDLYQSLQKKPVFKGCEQLLSLLGDGSGRARFLGVYRVLSEEAASKSMVTASCPYKEWKVAKHYYRLEKCPEFADLEGRVVVDWGSGALAWHQHLKNKPVIEIFPKGRLLPPFTDYLDFALSYDQLVQLIDTAEAHRDWKTSLSAVAGVYLILAETTGHHYVGSAYGLGGFWTRWSQYATTGDGGNVELRSLVENEAAYPKAFRFSILHVLPKTTAPEEVIRRESLYKIKLGAKTTGLNLN
jgi:hypothetical protein